MYIYWHTYSHFFSYATYISQVRHSMVDFSWEQSQIGPTDKKKCSSLQMRTIGVFLFHHICKFFWQMLLSYYLYLFLLWSNLNDYWVLLWLLILVSTIYSLLTLTLQVFRSERLKFDEFQKSDLVFDTEWVVRSLGNLSFVSVFNLVCMACELWFRIRRRLEQRCLAH